ncbi:bifunctional tetrahydrofolate synthase/dihydrofolate synthase [Catenulispora pinisilvae]|uniref:bifunctional tetrahydrofolate synthase/dihydrofolate synthase n=1 Tax=Catenulispora pinisilvae TaxID=2705253 RepID=UPI001891FD7B|nr:folylpolyglutamate synthase/dihydrofolate synthase family protein [Catenulispora pinisilvae]
MAKNVDPELQEQFEEVQHELLERWPETKMDPTLARVRALTELLGDPQKAYPVIHITGTNGKTSTARMIETLLRELNLRTGRFTSPHLESMNERITLDGAPIPIRRFVEVYEDIRPYVDIVDGSQEFPLSFFEVITGMAFAAFADAPVDAAVLEVGLGGTWDCTNVADGQVAVITPIDVDHAHILGDTPALIASEKAGIIKEDALVIMAQQPLEAAEVILRRAGEVHATVAREGLEYGVVERQQAVGGQLVTLKGLASEYTDVFLPLYGAHMAHNAATALAAVEAFLGVGRGGTALDPDVVREAFAKVTSPGRLEVVRRGPTVIVDATHNPAGARATVQALGDDFSFDHLVGVLGMMRDKDVAGILEVLEPALNEVVITQNTTERAMPAAVLAELATEIFGAERVHLATRLDDAIDLAIGLAEEAIPAGTSAGAGVIVTGSVVTAGQARTLLVRDGVERVVDRHSFEDVRFEDAEKEDFDDRDLDLFGDRDGDGDGEGGGDREGGRRGDREDLTDTVSDFEDEYGGDDR